MDKRKKALLIGLALGDGHLNSNSGVALEIEHGHKQKFYVEYKANLISKLLNCPLPKIYHNIRKDDYKISKGHRYFRIIKNWLYVGKEKRFSKKILNLLTPEAIAIWFMDDGSHSVERNKLTGRIRSHKMVIYTFTNEEDTQNIIDYFYETYNIKFYPIGKTMKDGSRKYYIQCRTHECRKLSDLLRPYILKEFQYKIMQIGE